ncbi:YciI family protein [Chitinimonas sp.]|uniref:YciI family protein n=1 Tax=Chitinimonas sp. TaxID=1934313 RepID=UPI0035ADBF0C
MFVVVLTYVKPLEFVDSLIDAHVRWLQAQYAAGYFLASGRRVPRTGGVILAQGLDRATLDAVLAQDPFQQQGAAQYEVIEFTPGMVAEPLRFLMD